MMRKKKTQASGSYSIFLTSVGMLRDTGLLPFTISRFPYKGGAEAEKKWLMDFGDTIPHESGAEAFMYVMEKVFY